MVKVPQLGVALFSLIALVLAIAALGVDELSEKKFKFYGNDCVLYCGWKRYLYGDDCKYGMDGKHYNYDSDNDAKDTGRVWLAFGIIGVICQCIALLGLVPTLKYRRTVLLGFTQVAAGVCLLLAAIVWAAAGNDDCADDMSGVHVSASFYLMLFGAVIALICGLVFAKCTKDGDSDGYVSFGN